MTQILVVAPSAVVRAGLEAVLSSSPGLQVVGALPALDAIDSSPEADVLLVDVNGGDGLARLRVSGPDAPPLVVLGEDLDVGEALRAGARGVLPREAEPDEIVAAVEAAAAGLVALRPESVALLPQLAGRAEADIQTEELTPREVEVLSMMADGAGNKQIARRLGISEHTVKFHVGSILSKLHASSRTEAVTIGIRQGRILV